MGPDWSFPCVASSLALHLPSTPFSLFCSLFCHSLRVGGLVVELTRRSFRPTIMLIGSLGASVTLFAASLITNARAQETNITGPVAQAFLSVCFAAGDLLGLLRIRLRASICEERPRS